METTIGQEQLAREEMKVNPALSLSSTGTLGGHSTSWCRPDQ